MTTLNKSIRFPGEKHGTTSPWFWVRHVLWRGGMSALFFWVAACSAGPEYFQDKLNEATQDMVSERHGQPHRVQSLPDGGQQWTYFKRGSGIATYSGQSRGGLCRAYVLSFDSDRVLRAWQQQSCQG
jgi:hypothetical protein